GIFICFTCIGQQQQRQLQRVTRQPEITQIQSPFSISRAEHRVIQEREVLSNRDHHEITINPDGSLTLTGNIASSVFEQQKRSHSRRSSANRAVGSVRNDECVAVNQTRTIRSENHSRARSLESSMLPRYSEVIESEFVEPSINEEEFRKLRYLNNLSGMHDEAVVKRNESFKKDKMLENSFQYCTREQQRRRQQSEDGRFTGISRISDINSVYYDNFETPNEFTSKNDLGIYFRDINTRYDGEFNSKNMQRRRGQSENLSSRENRFPSTDDCFEDLHGTFYGPSDHQTNERDRHSTTKGKKGRGPKNFFKKIIRNRHVSDTPNRSYREFDSN
ncbi:hypothetical protein HK098_001525, partial [Nowakowskiella sp. JEL0407]